MSGGPPDAGAEADFGDLFADESPDKPKADQAEADFGDLFAEDGGAAAEAEPMSAEEQEWRRSIDTDRERARSMGAIEMQVQSAVVEALADELRRAAPEEVAERLRAVEQKFHKQHVLRTAKLEALQRGLPDDVDRGGLENISINKSANQVEIMKVKAGGLDQKVVYKARDKRSRDAMEEDRFDLKENQMRKEWLGSQMDSIFNVGRNPVSTVNEAEPGLPGGAVIEFRNGVSGEEAPWEEQSSDDEISRVADFHYLIWEADGHNGQYIVEADGKLTTIDRGRSFMEGQQPLRSEAITAARDRQLGANPEVFRAVQRFLVSREMQNAAKAAFEVTFGREEGVKRYDQLLKRAETYEKNQGVPRSVKVERTPTAQEIFEERAERLGKKAA